MNKSKSIIKFSFILFLIAAGFYLFRRPAYPGKFDSKNISTSLNFQEKIDASGAILVNIDQDAEDEIFISVSGANIILKRKGDVFEKVKNNELEDPLGLSYSVSSCDLDQDGREEILLLNRPDKNLNVSVPKLFKFSESKWVNILKLESSISRSLENSYAATCIDRKGDGHYGLAITKEGGVISFLENENGHLKDIAQEIGLNFKVNGRSILGIPGPRGFTNLFLGNSDANLYFVNKGDGTFEEKASLAGLRDADFETRGSSHIDLNHDDLPDLVYGNHYGPIRLMIQTRDGNFKDITPESMVNNYAVNAAVVGDYNLDGYEDIYLNNIRGENKVYARHREEWFQIPLGNHAEKNMNGISTLAADLDQNGSYELLNTHGDGVKSPITLYTIGPQSDWIKLLVQYSNGSLPRGAVVKLRTSFRDMIKVISTGSGRFANYSKELLFGLLPHEKVLSTEVILPSGERIDLQVPLKIRTLNKLTVPLTAKKKMRVSKAK